MKQKLIFLIFGCLESKSEAEIGPREEEGVVIAAGDIGDRRSIVDPVGNKTTSFSQLPIEIGFVACWSRVISWAHPRDVIHKRRGTMKRFIVPLWI